MSERLPRLLAAAFLTDLYFGESDERDESDESVRVSCEHESRGGKGDPLWDVPTPCAKAAGAVWGGWAPSRISTMGSVARRSTSHCIAPIARRAPGACNNTCTPFSASGATRPSPSPRP